MNLYDIDNEIRALIDSIVDPETGEVLDEGLLDDLNALEIEKDKKIESTALYIKSQRAFAKAIENEIATLTARKKAALKRADWAEGYLSGFMNGEKFNSPKVSISWRKSQAVEITNFATLPKVFIRQREPEPDKAAISKALKSGKAVTGAKLVTHTSMVLK